MERQIATVAQDGHIVLPHELSTALQLKPGSEWEVSVTDSNIVLHPLLPAALRELRGMFKPGPSLEDDLMELRRNEKW